MRPLGVVTTAVFAGHNVHHLIHHAKDMIEVKDGYGG
jgi:hypothetical protein